MTAVEELLESGRAHHRAGRLAEAEGLYREALARAPDSAEAQHLLGMAAFQSGRLDEALARFRGAVAADGAGAKYHGNLGAALLALGRPGEALAALERAAALDPQGAEIHDNLGTALREAGRLDEALAAYGRAAEIAPDDGAIRANLAAALYQAGRGEEALAAAERACALDPGNAECHNTLGSVRLAAGRKEAALAAFERALALDPDYVEARCNLALLLQEAHRFEEAVGHYRQAVAARPDDAAVHAGLARALRRQGRLADALPHYRRAVALAPDNARFHSNLLFALLGDAETDAAALLAAHRAWGERHAAGIVPAAAHDNAPDPDRRLRIGYLSPDFRWHPVGRLVAPVIAAHDRAACEVVCYCPSARADAVTARIREAADLWRDVAGADDDALAAAVRADRIDILVDLAGHTARNRLLVLARRPAPVQASWLGYPATTGLAAIDYLIADPVHLPPGCEGEASEEVMRLPHDLLCFAPPAEAPDVGPLPAAAGHVTFGAFNNPGKVSAAAMALWAGLLESVPGARLVMRYRGLEDAATRDRLAARFAALGVAPDRIAFAGDASYAEVLDGYNRVDIALDSFPYSGTMTTLEALWMGVPVIAMAGARMAARQSAAHLAAAGLDELIAADAEDYRARAVALAGDRDRLARLRAGMRARLAASPLCDVAGFTRALEDLYRTMWRRWCAGRGG